MTTRMESRMKQLESTVAGVSTRLPTMDSTISELKNQMKDVVEKMDESNDGISHLHQKFEEVLRSLMQNQRDKQPTLGENSEIRSAIGGAGSLHASNTSGAAATDRVDTFVVNSSHRKLDLPVFNGIDPDSWIFHAERYFSMNRLTDTERVVAASICMEEVALSWFQWEDGRKPIRSWEELKVSLRQRFRNSHGGTLHARFLAIKQEGSIDEYRDQFEVLSAPLKNMDAETLEGVFLNGLNEEIQAEVLMINPKGLTEIMDTAKRVENRNLLLKKICDRDKQKLPRVTGL